MTLATSVPAPADSSQAAYDEMAPYYDAFSAHHDYELWLSNLLPALDRFGLRGRRLLDVACGTGKSFLPLLDSDWQITALDASPRMLAEAALKANGQVRLEQADMRALPRLGAFDLVWALGDALNYLLTLDELQAALVGLRHNLDRHGLLLFDLNTLLTYGTFYSETEIWEQGGFRLTWRGQTAEPVPGGLAKATFEAWTLEANGRVQCSSVHRQRHFPPDVVLSALERAGLRCLAVFGHHFDAKLEQPLDEARHTKAVFIAQPYEGKKGR